MRVKRAWTIRPVVVKTRERKDGARRSRQPAWQGRTDSSSVIFVIRSKSLRFDFVVVRGLRRYRRGLCVPRLAAL